MTGYVFFNTQKWEEELFNLCCMNIKAELSFIKTGQELVTKYGNLSDVRRYKNYLREFNKKIDDFSSAYYLCRFIPSIDYYISKLNIEEEFSYLFNDFITTNKSNYATDLHKLMKIIDRIDRNYLISKISNIFLKRNSLELAKIINLYENMHYIEDYIQDNKKEFSRLKELHIKMRDNIDTDKKVHIEFKNNTKITGTIIKNVHSYLSLESFFNFSSLSIIRFSLKPENQKDHLLLELTDVLSLNNCN